MSRIVCKFGGSSLADAARFQQVKQILAADAKRTLVVPSAPGKRSADDAKLTDLLYLCQDSARVGADFDAAFSRIRNRYTGIEKELGIDAKMDQHLDELYEKLSAGVSRDYVASRGEYLSGHLLAAFLNAEFVDPEDFITILANGNVEPGSYARLAARLVDESKRYVIPGFYGRDVKGKVKTFSRGGSDISGAIVARATGAEVYENWTDVSGLLMADPRIVDNPRPMEEVTYAEIRELSYMGATVLHDEAISPVREVGIPINIRNTHDPDHPGTRIVQTLSPEVEKNTEIAGIAGKKNFAMISLAKNLMNKEIGFGHRLLGILMRHEISFEHCPSSIDSVSVVVESAQLEDRVELVLQEIRQVLKPDQLEYVPEVAMIAVVGVGMARSIGIAAKLFAALRDAGVNVRLINQGASELNIIVGVDTADYERAVNAVYKSFVPN